MNMLCKLMITLVLSSLCHGTYFIYQIELFITNSQHAAALANRENVRYKLIQGRINGCLALCEAHDPFDDECAASCYGQIFSDDYFWSKREDGPIKQY